MSLTHYFYFVSFNGDEREITFSLICQRSGDAGLFPQKNASLGVHTPPPAG